MSTGCECLFFQWEPDEWYYLLEDYNAPKNSWDWRGHATCYGPFGSKDAAVAHLDANHANPGGWSTDTSPNKDNPVLQRHVQEAKQRGTKKAGLRFAWR